MGAGDEEAAGGGVLGGVVDRAGADVAVRPLVHGHHVGRVVPVPLHPLLHVAPFRRTPVVVPAHILTQINCSPVGSYVGSIAMCFHLQCARCFDIIDELMIN